jgi:hypothetical protein
MKENEIWNSTTCTPVSLISRRHRVLELFSYIEHMIDNISITSLGKKCMINKISNEVYHDCGIFCFYITAVFSKTEIVFFVSATTNMCHHFFFKNMFLENSSDGSYWYSFLDVR